MPTCTTMPGSICAFKIKNGIMDENVKVKRVTVDGLATRSKYQCIEIKG